MGAVFDLVARWTNPQNPHDQIVEMQVGCYCGDEENIQMSVSEFTKLFLKLKIAILRMHLNFSELQMVL